MVLLRHVRVLIAGLAVCLVPSWSRADTQILVQEVDSHGNVIAGTTQIFAHSTNITTTTLPNFSTVTITANPSSGAVSSLTTNVNATPTSTGFDSSIGLQVIVTSTGFTTPNAGGLANVTNNASASSAIAGGQNMLTSNTQLLNDPSGTTLGSATGAASDIRPSGGISPTTSTAIANFPGTFAIQQTITENVINVSSGGIASGSTLGGSASSLVATQPVPAPGGLALALVGLPLIGLRRWLKKQAA